MESQNIEYKESWRDEYLKWICGFANAQGGTLYIGVDDNGEVVGLNDVKKLSEDIPNKVRDKLGIVVEVNLLEKNDLAYLEIITQPSAFPINFNGEYHYRSGSTKQLLQGAALTQFLFDKTGMTWDCVLMNDLTVKDFRDEEFELFKEQAIRSHRMDKKDLDMDNEQILNHLGLIKEGKIMRAAMMLFHKNPEKWINGSYVKIGFFETDADLRYYDEIHGSLISQAEKTIDLLYTKYMKAEISYEGVTRIETYPFPKEAIREAVYNALVHKNYASRYQFRLAFMPTNYILEMIAFSQQIGRKTLCWANIGLCHTIPTSHVAFSGLAILRHGVVALKKNARLVMLTALQDQNILYILRTLW